MIWQLTCGFHVNMNVSWVNNKFSFTEWKSSGCFGAALADQLLALVLIIALWLKTRFCEEFCRVKTALRGLIWQYCHLEAWRGMLQGTKIGQNLIAVVEISSISQYYLTLYNFFFTWLNLCGCVFMHCTIKCISSYILVASGGSSNECYLRWIPSGPQKSPGTCWPAPICCHSGRVAAHDYKEKEKAEEEREASPVNQKCPIQVGPVLTCCHWDPHGRSGMGVGGAGMTIWYVFVSISTFVYVGPLKALIGLIDFSHNCYHKGGGTAVPNCVVFNQVIPSKHTVTLSSSRKIMLTCYLWPTWDIFIWHEITTFILHHSSWKLWHLSIGRAHMEGKATELSIPLHLFCTSIEYLQQVDRFLKMTTTITWSSLSIQSKVSSFYHRNNNSQNKITLTNRDNNIHRVRQGMTFVVYTEELVVWQPTLGNANIYGHTLTSWEYLEKIIGI